MSVHEPVRIEKLMSLTLREFQYTIAPLAGGPLASDRNDVQIALAGGTVVVAYDPRPSVRLGGLMDMPRAIVSLTFRGLSQPERDAFIKRFDFTFQRGGG